MKKMVRGLMGMATVVAMSAMITSGAAAADAEYTIKLANSNAPFTDIDGQSVIDAVNAGCFAFENYVEQASGGRIEVEIYDSGALGGSVEGCSSVCRTSFRHVLPVTENFPPYIRSCRYCLFRIS